MNERCKDFFENVSPTEDIHVYLVGDESDVDWEDTHKIREPFVKNSTFLCYTPLRAKSAGYCEKGGDDKVNSKPKRLASPMGT